MPIAGWGFAPAIAAGNAVVLKPAEITPLTAIRIGELAVEAGLPPGVLTVVPGQGVGRGAALRHPSRWCARSASPARPRSGKQHHGRLRRPAEEGHPRARWQERQHRLRRRGRRRGGGRRAVRRLRQRRAGLLRALADPRRAYGVRRVRRAPARRRSDASGSSDPVRRRTARWDRWSRAGQRESGRSATSMGDDASPSRGRGARRAGLVATADGRRSRDTVRDRIWREEVFGPVVAVLRVRRRGACDRHGQRQRLRALGLDLHPRPRPGAAGRARGRGRRTSASTRTRRVRYWTPFGGYKQSGLGRELGPDALDAFTEVKNVFIAH